MWRWDKEVNDDFTGDFGRHRTWRYAHSGLRQRYSQGRSGHGAVSYTHLVPNRGISLAAATVRGLILTVSHKEQIGELYPQVLETLRCV